MEKFEVGDIVTWIVPDTAYSSGPYLVARIWSQDKHREDSVFLTHLDGSSVYWSSSSDGRKYKHEYIFTRRLRLDPFLDAARKAIHAQKTQA